MKHRIYVVPYAGKDGFSYKSFIVMTTTATRASVLAEEYAKKNNISWKAGIPRCYLKDFDVDWETIDKERAETNAS